MQRSLGFTWILAGGLALCACSGAGRGNAVPTPPPPVVEVATVRRATVPITADFIGTTGAITSIEVRARVSGTLESAPFKEGTLVHQGQVIFTLQQTQYLTKVQAAQAQVFKGEADLKQATQSVPVVVAAANVAQKRALLERSKTTVARLTPLARAKAIPQKDLDNALTGEEAASADFVGALAQLRNAKVAQQADISLAQAEILQAQSQLTDAGLDLSYTTITAPVTGLIGFLRYDVGNVVGGTGTGTDVLDTITTVDPIKVDFGVDEDTYLALAGREAVALERPMLRQPVRLVLANNKIYDQSGHLYTVNPTLDAKTGTISVEARFPNPDALLRPGQFARVRLIVEERRNAVLVPQTAVVQAQSSDSVYVLESDGTAALRSVTLGPRYRSAFVVNGGLQPGQRVVIEGAQKLHPGVKVVIAPASSSRKP